jgi:hypothetical protein
MGACLFLRTNAERVSIEAAHPQNSASCFSPTELQPLTSDKATVVVVGSIAGVCCCRRFCRYRQNTRKHSQHCCNFCIRDWWQVVARLKHVVKLAEAVLGSGAHMVVLERFCCSRQGDVRPIGGEVTVIPSAGARSIMTYRMTGLTTGVTTSISSHFSHPFPVYPERPLLRLPPRGPLVGLLCFLCNGTGPRNGTSVTSDGAAAATNPYS